MKAAKILILSLAGILACQTVHAWASLGHATIAKVAETHLSSKTKKACSECLDGLSIVAVASDADIYRGRWAVDLGFIPTNLKTTRGKWIKEFDFDTPLSVSIYSHTFAVDENCRPYHTQNFNGVYKGNACLYVDQISSQLKREWKTMDKAERKKILSVLVHLVGDMHCPDHIEYADEPSIGQFQITFMSRKMKRHELWDHALLSHIAPWSFSDLAYLVDTASKSEIKKITEGDVYDWGYDSALCCKGVHEVKAGDALPRSYAADQRALVFSQISKAGYRLASILNEIFK